MQRNWIGRSEGLLVRFALEGVEAARPGDGSIREVEVYTTRPDTLFGARFLAVAPDHPLAEAAARTQPELAAFIEECRRTGTAQEAIDRAEKLGFDTGLQAIHPLAPDIRLPVYVANFVLMEYGTGAIFGCPAHDQRDLDFVNKYGLGVIPVVLPAGRGPGAFAITDVAYTGDGTMIHSRFLDGLSNEAAWEEVARRLDRRDPGRSPRRRAPRQFPAARLGHLAPALLGLPDPGDPLPGVRGRAGAGGGPARRPARGRVLRRPGQPARPPPDLEARPLPSLRRRGPARDGHHGHLRGFVLVLRPLHRPVRRRGADRPGRRGPLAAGGSVHRRHRARDPAPALFPLLHPRDARHRPCRAGRALRRAVHPGHGRPRDLPRPRTAPGCSPTRFASTARAESGARFT